LEYSFAILDQVKAKSAIITVLTMFDQDGVIENVNIVKYNGNKGRAVMDDHWLGQFEGKDQTSDFNIGTGVDGMTGATFSASAIIRGVHKLSLLFDTVQEKCKLPVH
jgi:Na+-translocating ferredoxin:NAD+ oxidoreductase RnfG subunit